MSSKMKNWNVQGDHRPTSIINAEKANKKAQEAKKKKMFDCFAIADLAIEVSKISVIDGIKGTNFRNPKMNQKVSKVEMLLDDIQKSEIGQVVTMLPEYVEVMQNEHALEIYRWFQLMAFYPTEHLREFNDGVEAQNEAKMKGIEPDPLFTKEDLQKAFEYGIESDSDTLSSIQNKSNEEAFEEYYSRIKKQNV